MLLSLGHSQSWGPPPFSCMGYPVFCCHLLEGFYPLTWLWLSFYLGLSTPLIGLYASPYATPTSFKYCSFGSLELRKCESSNFVLIFQNSLVGDFLEIPYELRDGNFCIEIMIVIALHAWSTLGDAAVIATMSSPPGHELRISLQIFVMFNHSFIDVL